MDGGGQGPEPKVFPGIERFVDTLERSRNMMKRLALGAAITVIAFQALTGVAAACAGGTPGKCLGSDPGPGTSATSCNIAAGVLVVPGGTTLWADGTYVYCDAAANKFALEDVTSALVSGNGVTFLLEDGATPVGPGDFGGLKITVDVSGTIVFDASTLGAYNAGNVTASDTKFSAANIDGVFYAGDKVQFDGSGSAYVGDNFDGSKITQVAVEANGGAGPDVLKGGDKGDMIAGGDGADRLYGNGGSDALNCDDAGSAPGNDQCWGGAGNDGIELGGVKGATGYDVAAPGDGFDSVVSDDAFAVTYVDSSVAVEFSGWDADAEDYLANGWSVETDVDFDALSGTADDLLVSVAGSNFADKLILFPTLDGGNGADIIVGTDGDDSMIGGGGNDRIRTGGGDDEVYGSGGNDLIYGGAGDDKVFGGGGDDVMYGAGGSDLLKGNKGADQGWGGPGSDLCASEVRDNCEFRKG